MSIYGITVPVLFKSGNPVYKGSLTPNSYYLCYYDQGNTKLYILNADIPNSNPNILDNWYFLDPINQRGKTEYTAENNYSIDRWQVRAGTNADKLTLSNDGVTLTRVNNNAAYFHQRLDGIKDLVGKEIIFSILYKSDCVCRLFISGAEAHIQTIPASSNWTIGYMTYTPTEADANAQVFGACIQIHNTESPSGGSITVQAAKLELGTIQTLVKQDANGNWILIDGKPNIEVELAKCQRYFIQGPFYAPIIKTYNGGNQRVFLSLPVTMRKFPTLGGTPILNYIDNTGISINPDTLQVYSFNKNGIIIISTSSKELTAIDGEYWLSADL